MADIYVSTSGSDSTGTGASGSPYATPGKAAGVMSGGDRILIKYGNGTSYTQTSSSFNVAGGIPQLPAGTWNSPSQIVGYQTTVGDLDDVDVKDNTNAPVIQSYATGGTSVLYMNGNFCQARNLVIDGASHAAYGVYTGSQYNFYRNVKSSNCTTTPFAFGNYGVGLRLLGLGGSYAFQVGSSLGVFLDSCVAAGAFSTCGFSITTQAGCAMVNCVACAGGASADGIQTTYGHFMDRCVSYGNGRDGIRFMTQAAVQCLRNSIFYGNSGYGINLVGATSTSTFDGNYNAYGANTSGNLNNVNAGGKDVTLSANPFSNAGGTINVVGDAWTNFALSSGGLTALKAKGYPAYLDIGAVQHQDSGAGGGLLVHPGMTGGMRG